MHSNHPGIFFLKSSIVVHLTVEHTSISRLEDMGIEITIPENSLKEPLELSIHPCFSGPFDLPHGYESASPAYLIKHSKKVDFLKDVTVKIQHYACLQSEEDCEDMVFLSASSIPQYRESSPVYVFREMQGEKGRFRPGDKVGEVSLRHFCVLKLGKRKRGMIPDSSPKKYKGVILIILHTERCTVYLMNLCRKWFILFCKVVSKHSS